MKLDAALEPVAITIESTGEPLSAVRVERAEGVAQRVSIHFENGTVVVTCGANTILELPSEPKRRPLPLPEISLVTIGDAEWHPATPTATQIGVSIEAELMPPESVARSRPPEAPQALDPGDAPTRVEYHPPSEGAAFAPARAVGRSAAPPPAAGAAPAAKGPRIRRSVRRFALLAMLAVSWMLWFHAYRNRHTHASRTTTGASSASSRAAASAASPGSSAAAGRLAAQLAPGPAGASTPIVPPFPPAAAPAASTAPSRAPNVTEARAAADALANGDYANAVKLYDDLASKSANNPAYAEVARSLRARTAPLPQ